MWSLTPKWKSKNPQKRLQGLNKLNPDKPEHLKILTEIVKNDEDFEVRQFAFKILGKDNSQEALLDIATNDKHPEARIIAIEKIEDQKKLADIAKNDEYWGVRDAAIEKLTDQNLLANIAKDNYDECIRKVAIEKLTDQRILVDIANNADIKDIRIFIEKLKDKSVLADVASSIPNIYSIKK